jgi:hypothetical protein
MAKKKPSEGDPRNEPKIFSNEAEEIQAISVAEEAVHAKEQGEDNDIHFGDVPLCREYFFNRKLVEDDLTNVSSGKDVSKKKKGAHASPAEPGKPWTVATYSGEGKGFSSWRGSIWCMGNDIDGVDYVAVAAEQYGIVGARGSSTKPGREKTFKILQMVASGAPRSEVEEAIEAAKGKKKKTDVDSVTTDTSKKAKDATKIDGENEDVVNKKNKQPKRYRPGPTPPEPEPEPDPTPPEPEPEPGPTPPEPTPPTPPGTTPTISEAPKKSSAPAWKKASSAVRRTPEETIRRMQGAHSAGSMWGHMQKQIVGDGPKKEENPAKEQVSATNPAKEQKSAEKKLDPKKAEAAKKEESKKKER